MAGESSARRRRPSRENIGTIVPRIIHCRLSKFGRVAVALWPDKPALNLAQRAGISERGAQYLIDGRRKPNARAMHALSGYILDED